MNKWPFDLWLRFAVRRFGLSPNEFWAMSVVDFLALIEGELSPPLTHASLSQMMKIFPDEDQNE